MQAQIVGFDPGVNNRNLDGTIKRLVHEGAYKDLSCIVVIPALNTVATKAASSWLNLLFPPNQKVVKLFAQNMEVGDAYDQTIAAILANPELSKYKYLMTIEADNALPPDAVVRLMQRMEDNPQYSCIGGLYYTKGGHHDGSGWVGSGVGQIWGDINDPVLNFRPVPPKAGELVECYGTGMGANLWRLSMFKDDRLPKPLFKTTCSVTEGCYTQDLRAWVELRKLGHRCAIDCSVLVGHVDMQSGFVW